MDKVGIARGLFYYYYGDIWKFFLDYLKVPYIVSPNTNKEIMMKGIKKSNDEMGMLVDNFNSNGMVAPVDEKTGVVTQVAIDKKKNTYVTHPETGSKIKGFQFPYWDKVLEMVDKAAKVVPEMGYAGWDVGFTPDGPLFVEGNEFPGHDIYQLPEHTPDKIGMMPKFNFEKE